MPLRYCTIDHTILTYLFVSEKIAHVLGPNQISAARRHTQGQIQISRFHDCSSVELISGLRSGEFRRKALRALDHSLAAGLI